MSEMNSKSNRIVWCDIPVAQLERASTFYRAVLGIQVERVDANGMLFAIFEHAEGNGVCLVPHVDYRGSQHGPLVYLNADQRIRAAVEAARKTGGAVVEEIHPIGPHGFRAIIDDSEGNRVALHSTVDA